MNIGVFLFQKEDKMKEFKELSKESYLDNEKKYIDYWDKINVLQKSIDKKIQLQYNDFDLGFFALKQ